MRSQKIILLLLFVIILGGCASGYKMINPQSLNYQSSTIDKAVTFDYKYNLLYSRYAKKETNNKVRLIAVKIANNSGKALVFGKDIKLTYTNGHEIAVMDADKVYGQLKQGSLGYLFYLLLTPAKLNVTNGVTTSSTPIGYAIGPGLALGNIIAATSANDNFKKEIMQYNINGSVIKNGETAYGLIGIESDNFDAIKIKVEYSEAASLGN